MTSSKSDNLDKLGTMVREFHSKFGFPVDRDLHLQGVGVKVVTSSGDKVNISSILMNTSSILAKASEGLLTLAIPMQAEKDERAYRAHLMLEELSEVLMALAERDEVSLADGLTDLSYVVQGTLISYGLPGQALFEEVHSSNMTKSRNPGDPRMKEKDMEQGYRSPDIKTVLLNNESMLVGEIREVGEDA